MSISYNRFTEVFLDKVTEYNFIKLDDHDRSRMVDGYMKRACAQFSEVCKYNLNSGDDVLREFLIEIPENEIDEIIDIVSDGMLVQWMKPYVYAGENLKNMLSTTDFKAYSPAELLNRVKNAYEMCRKEFTNRMREYSYRHGDLTQLHL